MTTKQVAKPADTAVGMSQQEAKKLLTKAAGRIRTAVKGIDSRALVIGRELNVIKASGLAVAAYTAIGDADSKKQRDFSVDGRHTAVGRFIAEKLGKSLSKQTAFKYMATAERSDQLTAAGIDVSQFSDSTFRSVVKDTTAADFVAVVETMLEAEEPKLEAADFTAAGREAGIVKPANVGGGGSPLLKAANAMLQALKADDIELSKTEAKLLKSIAKRIGVVVG